MENDAKNNVQVSFAEKFLSSDSLQSGAQVGTAAKWRKVIKFNLLLVVLVLLANVCIFAWAWTRPLHTGGVSSAYSGSCATMSRISLWAHLAINILSTVLLGAGNYCVQCLIAPTRPELDDAHARGRWLDTGLISFRNFKASSGRHKIIILFISLSSVPLHLIYNSIVIGTPSANEYMALLVAKDFLTGGSWQDYDQSYTAEGINHNEVQYLQDNINILIRLENAECMSTYSHTLISSWTNVLLVSSAKQANHTVIEGFNYSPATESTNWQGAPEWALNPDNTLQDPNDWIRYEPTCNGTAGADYNFFCNGHAGGNVGVQIEYCLAQPFEPKCSIKISTTFLAIVLVCNVVKIVCIVAALSASTFQPLLTVGDAVCSFLEVPDTNTRNLGPISAKQVQDLVSRNEASQLNGYLALQQNRSFKNKKHRWYTGASGSRWILTLTLCLITWIGCIILLKLAITWGAEWKGLGAADPESLISISAGRSLASNILLSNLPQLIISILYVLYNSLLTSMLLASEFCSFARKKKGLRVSNKPTGAQRSTYWLQLPYRYAVPMMVLMAVLHWLVSQSIFLVRVDMYDNNQNRIPYRDISACGYSMYGLVASLSVGLALIFALMLCGAQMLGKGAPVVRSNSLAISAAANGRAEEATMLLMYGVISDDDLGYGQGLEEPTRKRVGFGAGDVHPLVDGEIYQ